MSYDLLFKNARLALPAGESTGDLAVQDGRIAAIGRALDAPAREIIDLAAASGHDFLLLPGAIDAHTHFNLTAGGRRVNGGWPAGAAAARRGGTTSVIEHISFGPPGSAPGAPLQAARVGLAQAEAREKLSLNVFFHGVVQSVDKRLPACLAREKERGVASWKAYTTYAYPLAGPKLERLLCYTKACGVLLCVHCEDDALLAATRERLAAEGKLNAAFHALSRPAAAEAVAIRGLLAAARAAGDAPVYIVHLSTASGLEIVRAARAAGQQNIYCETCPQYLLLDESYYAAGTEQALRACLSPPLRTTADNRALWRGLAAGDIDVLATDHCNFTLAQKRPFAADLRRTPNGAPGAEERLTLLLSEGVRKGRISLARAVDAACAAPARIFGLAGKGALSVGADADLALFDRAAPQSFGDTDAAYSLYAGMRLTGRVDAVWLAGRRVYRRGENQDYCLE